MTKTKLTAKKVQIAFNKAICERDKQCTISTADCAGRLECSHFFPVGGNGGLRFYPGNAYAQCSGHHLTHHNRDPLMYAQWMQKNHKADLEWMESVRGKPVQYTQPVLRDIQNMCKDGLLTALTLYIEELIGGRKR